MTEVRSGDRLIVRGRSSGSQFPKTESELLLGLELDGTTKEGPFVVEGSVYGRGLRFLGPGTVVGPVLGRGDIRFEPQGTGVQRFLGGVGASGNIVGPKRATSLRSTLTGDIGRAELVFRGSVAAENVVLENAVIFGNVRGSRIRLASSVVFGQVVATETLELSGSTVLAYASPKVTFQGPNMLLHGMGVSEGVPAFKELNDGHEIFPADLRYYPVLRAVGPHSLTFRPWEPQHASMGESRIVPADFVRFTTQEDNQSRHVLSLAGRVLDFRRVRADLEVASFLLRSALEFDHYAPDSQAKVRKKWKELGTRDELHVLQLVTAPAVAPAPPPMARPQGRAS